jgi:acetyl-CoA synthetase
VPDELRGEVAVLLVVIRRDMTIEPETLAREVGDQVAHGLGKPVRPAAVVVVPDLPRTRSGKIMRRVARAAWLGQDPGDLSALENADAVTAIGELGAGARGGA